jgi:hypothetical protein
MTLAAVLVVYLSTWGSFRAPLSPILLAAQSQPGDAQSQPQNPATPTPDSASTSTTPNVQPQNSPSAAQAPAKHRWHRKKTAATTPDCATSPVTTKSSAEGQPSNSTASSDSTKADNGNGAAAPKPCPTPKVVVKNGGSDEPTITLTGKTTAEQASQQRYNTEQLTAAAEANLKNITTRQLSPTQQEMVSQVKLFLEQSKKAVADGDLQRGHDFAVKAQLLSSELLKP